MSLEGAIAANGNTRGWSTIAFRSLFSQSKADNRPNYPLLGVNLHSGVTQRSANDGRPAASEDLTAYKVVAPGNIIMNRLGKPHGSVGMSPWEGITSPAYWVMGVNPQLGEPRFLHHLLRSRHLVAEYERLGKNQPPNQFDISWDAFRAIEIPLPSLEEQRHIADFLDAETARINQLTSMRVRQSKLLDDRRRSQLSELIESLTQRFGCIRLRHVLLRIEQGWSPQCEDRLAEHGEWGVVKAGCVNSGRFDPIQHKALPSDVKPRREFALKKGDLLMSRASGSLDLIGSVGVVGEISDNLLLCDKVYRIKLDWTRAQADFVAHVLRGHQARERIKNGISGAEGMANNLPTSVIKDLLLPNVPVSKQASFSDSLRLRAESVARARDSLHRSIQTLTERRQALITAAVTGQFDVSTASGRNVTDGVTA
ncbi:restriction endonuclease subunit S [Streptomyces sp. NPDC058735]|uniref:restriction endonuclease subunit S n=1 Tax=unclassified Streptomyces TaxID=2593676 RepID=UPI0036A4B0EB